MNRSKKSAHRESLEEAGVLGSLEGELGTWSYKSKSHNTIYEGCIFSLLVEEQLDLWPEKNVQQRLWMTVGEAAKEVCGHWWMKEDLDVLIQRLAAPKTHGLWQPERKEVRDSHTTKFSNKAKIKNIELLELRSMSAGVNVDSDYDKS
ncbi:Nudix hydrolase 17, mitochondrial [Dionaea muscipula]